MNIKTQQAIKQTVKTTVEIKQEPVTLIKANLEKEEFLALLTMIGNMSPFDMAQFCSDEEVETLRQMYFQMQSTYDEATGKNDEKPMSKFEKILRGLA